MFTYSYRLPGCIIDVGDAIDADATLMQSFNEHHGLLNANGRCDPAEGLCWPVRSHAVVLTMTVGHRSI